MTNHGMEPELPNKRWVILAVVVYKPLSAVLTKCAPANHCGNVNRVFSYLGPHYNWCKQFIEGEGTYYELLIGAKPLDSPPSFVIPCHKISAERRGEGRLSS